MKKVFKNKFVMLLLLCLCISFFAMLPLFHSGFFPIHDDEQIGRLIELHKILLQGQLPPRWVPDLGFGYGYPLYNFYPPLFYYVGELFKLFGFSFILATKGALILGFVLSAASMFAWVKNRWGFLPGIIAAVVYTYVPYHAVDIYVRGAFSEFFAFIFVPAVFWGIDMVSMSSKKQWSIFLSLLLAGLVLSHNLVAMQAIPFILIYSLFVLWENKKESKRIFISLILSGMYALGLCAYFWLPALLEKKFTLVDKILIKELANYSIHFVYPIQLWNSLWGYGGSAAGLSDGLSFQLGKLQILFVGGSLMGVLIPNQKKRAFPLLLLFLFCFSVFLTTNYSKIIWDHISPLWYIQFPWRFLLFAGVFSAALCGYVYKIIQQTLPKKFAIIIFVFISILFILQVRNDFKPQKYLLLQDNHYMQSIVWDVSRMSYEYVPKEVATRKSSLGTTELAINRSDLSDQSYRVLSGDMQIQEFEDISQEKRYLVRVTTAGVLQFNTYAFPGWIVIVDGEKVSYNDTNKLHLIQLPLDVGKRIIEVKFINTMPRTVGNSISLLCWLGFILFLGAKIKKHYEKTYS